MTFSEKIAIILKTNKLGIATNEDLSEFAGFNRDTIRKAIDRKSKLNKSNTRILTDKIGINPDWWDSGKGEIYMKNLASVQNSHDNKEKTLGVNGDQIRVLREVLEEGTEYRIIPKTILDGEYRIMPKKELDKYERQFDKIDERTQVALKAKDQVIQMKDDLLKERDQAIREREERILSLERQLGESSQNTK